MVAQEWYISNRLRITAVSVLIGIQLLQLLSSIPNKQRLTLNWWLFLGLWIQWLGNLAMNDDLSTMGWEALLVIRSLTYLWDMVMLNYVLYLVNIANQATAVKYRKVTPKLPKSLLYVYVGLSVFIIIMHIISLSVSLATDEVKYDALRLFVLTFGLFVGGGIFLYFTGSLKWRLWGTRPNPNISRSSYRDREHRSMQKNPTKDDYKTEMSHKDKKQQEKNEGEKKAGDTQPAPMMVNTDSAATLFTSQNKMSSIDKMDAITSQEMSSIDQMDAITLQGTSASTLADFKSSLPKTPSGYEKNCTSTASNKLLSNTGDKNPSKAPLSVTIEKGDTDNGMNSTRRKHASKSPRARLRIARAQKAWNSLQMKLTGILLIGFALYIMLLVVALSLTSSTLQSNKKISQMHEEEKENYNTTRDVAWWADVVIKIWFMQYCWNGIDFHFIFNKRLKPFLTCNFK
ncbi:hypothetical protein AAMO2058_001588500 [Amorphochlora amoebiformis]